MKRKGWIVLLIAAVLIIVFIGPAAPLWVNLGMKMFCIQGTFPKMKIVSCAKTPVSEGSATSAASATPLPLPSESAPVPLIVDDDGSPDGMIALMYFLRHPLFEVKAVTISSGEAHPEKFAPQVLQLLAGLGHANIPVGAGRETPLEGNNAFPTPWREASDVFWNLSLPGKAVSASPQPAAKLIAQVLSSSPQPVVVFVSGTHTNLAEALRDDPTLVEHIREVHIMGGAVNRGGNISSDWAEIDNRAAEWNIWVDPVAASEVFSSGAPLHLTPLDATDQVLWTKEDARRWAEAGTPEGKFAADLLNMTLNSWGTNNVLVWDLVAAADALDPALCLPVKMALAVRTEAGNTQGQTIQTDQTPNISVCLKPDAAQIKARVNQIFSR